MRLSRLSHSALFVVAVWPHGAARAGDWDRHPGSLSVAPDDLTVAAACGDKAVRIWNATDGKLLHRLVLDNPARGVASIGRTGDLARSGTTAARTRPSRCGS